MKILIIEEEKMLADSLKLLLHISRFEVDTVSDGSIGMEYALLGAYDLLILDTTFPGMDNLQIVKQLRLHHCAIPVMMLAEKSDIEGKIAGLNAGADYYLSKPFDSRELLACINAILRRQGNQIEMLEYGNTKLDLSTCLLICGQKNVRLSAREFEVMRLLLQSGNRIISKDVILARVWGVDSHAVDNHVEVYIGFLRKKLASISSNIRITALRRLGYQLEIE